MHGRESVGWKKSFRSWLWTLFRIVAGLLFCFGVPVLAKATVLKPLRFSLFHDSPAGQLFQWGGSLFLVAAGYVLFVRLSEKRGARELSPRNFFPHMAKGFLWGSGSIAFLLCLLYFTGLLSILGANRNAGNYHMVLLCFLLSTTEEFMYRGVVYRIVERSHGTVAALVLSSLLFSILHLTNDYFNVASFVAIVIGGAIMGLLYTATKSLWWPIAAHFGWNFAQILAGLTLSGMDDFSSLALVESRVTGPEVLTGGAFGIENSLYAIIYTAVAAGYLAYRVFYRVSGKA